MTSAVKEAMKAAAMAAMDVAEDVATGRLHPAQLDAAALQECRTLVGTVDGPTDILWPLQVDIARQVLAVGGVPADELAEWAAVQRQADGVEAAPEPSWIERTMAQLADDDVEAVDG